MTTAPSFRAHPLDGAMLYFEPRSGWNVRVENRWTGGLRRAAPRVVMFGITNACNLRCDFCSRDTSRASQWTVESAAEMLEALSRAGTLEVAFGGGEPFAFRGLRDLVVRLRRTTSLAIHVTTNGTMLEDIDFDQVRLSIYDGWRHAAQRLVGRRWGANVLVDDRMVDRLPVLLNELAALGATDASLLSYVGPDPERQLTCDLSAIVRAAPLACRVSVCFGDRSPGLDRIRGGDCGAGLDFVTLTSDRRMQSCSFQDVSHPVGSAEELLALWRQRELGAPSPRAGCHRESRATESRGVRVWQGFSGNNSGECVLVAHFEEVAKAEKLLADVLPGFEPGQPYAAPWRELFERERVAGPHAKNGHMPDELGTIGRAFVARTDSAMGDDFPELRALAWRRGARVQPGGIHEHRVPVVLYALRARDAKDAERLAARHGAKRHGRHVIGTLKPKLDLEAAKQALLAFRRPFALELFAGRVDLTRALQRVAASAKGASTPRLLASFWHDDERARRFAAEAETTPARNLVLVDRVVRRKRLALRAYGYGGRVDALEGDEVLVTGWFRAVPPPPRRGTRAPSARVDRASLERAVRVSLPRMMLEPEMVAHMATISVRTTTPAAALASLDAAARELALELALWVSDVHPLDRAIARLLADLG
ncbi:MAG: radical SAM protein [Labilithrix sp.]